MLKVQIIGHLGQDAILKTFNNVNYVSFSVAHSEKWKDNRQVEHEYTQWVSCLRRVGDGSGLQPYLKKGTKVYLEGSLSAKIFESQASSKPQVALNCNVSHLELLSSKQDSQTDSQAQQAPLLGEPNPINSSEPNGPGDGSDLPF